MRDSTQMDRVFEFVIAEMRRLCFVLISGDGGLQNWMEGKRQHLQTDQTDLQDERCIIFPSLGKKVTLSSLNSVADNRKVCLRGATFMERRSVSDRQVRAR